MMKIMDFKHRALTLTLQEKGDETNDPKIQVFVKTLTGKTITLDVKLSSTIDDVKAKIQDKDGELSAEQWVSCNGRALEGRNTLSDYGVMNEMTLQVDSRLRGGMIQPEEAGPEYTGIIAWGDSGRELLGATGGELTFLVFYLREPAGLDAVNAVIPRIGWNLAAYAIAAEVVGPGGNFWEFQNKTRYDATFFHTNDLRVINPGYDNPHVFADPIEAFTIVCECVKLSMEASRPRSGITYPQMVQELKEWAVKELKQFSRVHRLAWHKNPVFETALRRALYVEIENMDDADAYFNFYGRENHLLRQRAERAAQWVIRLRARDMQNILHTAEQLTYQSTASLYTANLAAHHAATFGTARDAHIGRKFASAALSADCQVQFHAARARELAMNGQSLEAGAECKLATAAAAKTQKCAVKAIRVI